MRARLLRWYRRNRRDLPWRRTGDPYAIWISETMLQQTQVKTVIPYYHRFLNALPTVARLDRASTERVLALWSGLGYYRRAVALKEAARKLMRDYGGRFPADLGALRSLPGVGLYTAGALMSIAFNLPYPAVDGNARRVLQRLFGVRDEKAIRGIAERLVSASPPREWNQALMELGARVCLPREPDCPRCPVAGLCALRKSGARKPETDRARRKSERVDWILALIQRKDGKLLLHRQSEGALLSGLWGIPGGERKKGESLNAALSRHLAPLEAPIKAEALVGEIRHAITYRRIRACLYRCAVSKRLRPPDRDWSWVEPRSLRRRPVSALSLKAMSLVHRVDSKRP
jgi:A/G-specific adenine glycosylase